jgi:hypothetical protein
MIQMELYFSLTVSSDFNNGCTMHKAMSHTHDDGIAIQKCTGIRLKSIENDYYI